MVHVLHINSNYLTSKLHENLAKTLSLNAIQSDIYMPIKKTKEDEFLFDSDFSVHHPVVFKEHDKYFFMYKQRKIMRALVKHYKDLSTFDLTHAHTLFTDGNVSLELFKKYGLPYVVTVRGGTDVDKFFKIRLNLRKKGVEILNHASSIIFLSEATRETLLSNYVKDDRQREMIRKKSVVLPNGIDSYWFENEGKPKEWNKDKPLKIITVGKIMDNKNQLAVLQAAKYLNERKKIKVEVSFAGSVFESAYLDKLKSADNIEFKYLGELTTEQLVKEYREHDLFVLVSKRETFGLVYPEAMSQGLPVIYTAGQGFDSQFEEGLIGYKASSQDPMELAEKIVAVTDHYQQFSINALKSYKRYNWQSISDQLSSMYQSAANKVSQNA